MGNGAKQIIHANEARKKNVPIRIERNQQKVTLKACFPHMKNPRTCRCLVAALSEVPKTHTAVLPVKKEKCPAKRTLLLFKESLLKEARKALLCRRATKARVLFNYLGLLALPAHREKCRAGFRNNQKFKHLNQFFENPWF